jgi:(2R)-ethylmalonyl-CoA mutase
MTDSRQPDRPWMMRTYSGHSTAKASNELYRTNLSKGQTGLSIAFDLPTQTGYDSDDPMARGEVGKVGVPVSHLGHMEQLLDGIPVGDMNTSMTINAVAAWMLGLYTANAERQGVKSQQLRGTTQNDIVKEYLSRGTYIYPPLPSRRLIVDMFAFCQEWIPLWNPMNVCSYHLQEAGATPVQEIAYSLATAIDVLDAVRDSGQVPEDRMVNVVASISFFVNAGIRFVEETCKMRAFTQMWDRICSERYGITDPKARRFLEALGVTLSKDARARSLQLPAWNEALGLPRPWDQQWALRIQQVLAYETDLLEYDDIFEGSKVVEAKTAELIDAAQAELDDVLALGGAFEAIDELKGRLVRSHAERMRRIESGDLKIVGVNSFTETAESPLDGDDNILRVDPGVAEVAVAELAEWRSNRDNDAVKRSLDELRRVARSGDNVMPASIDLAHAGGTTGEWAAVLREEFGEYRAPTGVAAAAGAGGGSDGLRAVAERLKSRAGGPPRFLVAKPGLDGHSNGAEQIAVAARDAGFEVIYQGIRLTPEQIAAVARDEDVDVVGLSILSGSHLELVPDVVRLLREAGVEAPVIAGGIIPEGDRPRLLAAGVAAVYTPKDFEIARIMGEVADLVDAAPAR